MISLFSYIKNRDDNHPYLNGNFFIFGRDSITTIKENPLLRNLQALKEESFMDLNWFFGQRAIVIPNSNQRVVNENGYSGFLDRAPINLESLFKNEPRRQNSYLNQFVNVRVLPNLTYFHLFNSITIENDMNVVYLLQPKPIYFKKRIEKMGYANTWDAILDSLISKKINFWNYENYRDFEFRYFDEIHLTHESATKFTKIIKKRFNSKFY